MLADVGFTGLLVGLPVDTFGDAGGEAKSRAVDVNGYPFLAPRP